MKPFTLLILLIALFSCKTDDSESQSEAQQNEKTQEVLTPPDVIDGPHTYNARALDSLAYTYSNDKANLKDGLYYLPETATAAINLLPLELWEHVVTRNENFYHKAKPKDTWCLIHRIDNVKFTTGARPITVKQEGEEFLVTIPFDGTSSSKISNLLDLRETSKYGLLIDERITCVFYEGKGIEADGLHYTTTKEEEVNYLKTVFNKTP